MIAADSSTLVAYLMGEAGSDIALVESAIDEQRLVLPPVVVTELLSNPHPTAARLPLLNAIQILAVAPGYWERAGDNRRLLLAKRLRASTTDALIAQSCIDADIPLITRDTDFRHFAAHCGLKLA